MALSLLILKIYTSKLKPQDIAKVVDTKKTSFRLAMREGNPANIQRIADDRGKDAVDDLFTGAGGINEGANTKEKVIQMFEIMISYHQDNSKRLNTYSSCVIGNMGQEASNQSKAIADKCSILFKKMIFGLQSFIELGQKDLSIKCIIESNYLADFIFNSFEGALIQRKTKQSDQPMIDYIHTLKKLL